MFDTNLENWAREFVQRNGGSFDSIPQELIDEIVDRGFNSGCHSPSWGFDRINWRHPNSRVWISEVKGDPERGSYFELW